jgi:hypothetical protein
MKGLCRSTRIGREYVKLRRKSTTNKGGTGSPRTVQHDPDNPHCRCADCRKKPKKKPKVL